MLLLKNKDKRDLVDGFILQHGCVAFFHDLFGLVDAHDFQSVEQVGDRDLLDLKHVVRVEDSLEVLSRQERALELVQAVVVWVSLIELLLLD